MKRIYNLIFIILINCGSSIKAQEINIKLDSLIGVWNNIEIDDTSRFQALNDFIWVFKSINSDSAFHYVDLMLSEASLKGFKKYIARSWSLRGTTEQYNEKKKLMYYQKALELYDSYGDLRGVCSMNNNIALLYRGNGMNDEALKIFRENVILSNELKSKGLLEVSYQNIGHSLSLKKEYDSAILYYNKCIKLCDELKKEMFIKHKFHALMGIGDIYNIRDNITQALANYQKCILIAESLNDFSALRKVYKAIGNLYFENENYNLSLTNYQKAEKYDLKYSGGSDVNILLMLYKNHSNLNNFKNASTIVKKYFLIKDSLNQMNSNKELIELKMDKEFSLLKEIDSIKYANEINLNQAEIASEKQRRNGLIIIILIVLFSLVFLYRQFTKTRKQKLVIESKQKEIKDSISYAKKIQDAIMTSAVYIEDILPKSFIFFQPKDVVSGDFYWVYQSSKNAIYIAVADCTGHGVPGAFMSMIGNSLLNEIIIEKKIENTGEILNSLREQIIKSLNQKEGVSETKDGMDMTLCKIDMKGKTVEFSGAYNSLIYVSDGELKTVKGDNQPVSLHYAENKSFTSNLIKVKKDDMIYLYSDGFQDQFGGLKDKKFMSLKFKNLLKKISYHSSQEQYLVLKKEFNEWKGSKEQIDDVCVMGVRII
tara:strand:+ start:157 stop:2118 length:1962 start_codon:yes stop_codon:yes gene_type:complete